MNNSDVESIVASFEKAFAENPETNVREFVPQNLENDFEIITELIRVDMELRWDTTQRMTIDGYLRSFAFLKDNKTSFEQIAFEEYRLRISAGEKLTPFDYQDRYSINVYHWPVLSNDLDAGHQAIDTLADDHDGISKANANQTTQPDLAARIVDGQLASVPTTENALHSRLRFFSLAIFISLLYLSILVWINPVTKVGLFLGSPWLLWVNGFCLVMCASICIMLWYRRQIPLSILRVFEVVLFGSVLLELSCGLGSDLFVDHELAGPINEGEHELFHYASSWSLPFFALIVAYGTLIPSSWLRCTIVVTTIAILPIAICTIAVITFHGFTFSFFQSFFMQMVIWMASGCLIAIYGVRRLEQTQDRFSKSGKLGKYQLIRRLATGGMGQIFLAEHRLLHRQCAVKLMHPEWASDDDLRTRFEREVQVLAGISHRNVVQVFDYGFTNDGIFYYVMEYLIGMDLKKSVTENGPLPLAEAIDVLIQITDALSVIHNGGIVHRDLKPSNIFLADSADNVTVKILDFGLLKFESVLEKDQQLTQAGAIIGTPAYMSPEQAAGRAVDHLTDIYSLGAVGFYLFIGKDVFDRSTSVETLNDHIKAAPRLPIQEKAEPRSLELHNILLRCLAKDPRCRFQSALELSRELKNILRVESIRFDD